MPYETRTPASVHRGPSEPDLSHHSRRLYADIVTLDRALALGDLETARTAFTRLQEDSPLIAEAVSRDPFPSRTRPSKALKKLGRHLLDGDLPRARRAIEHFYQVDSSIGISICH